MMKTLKFKLHKLSKEQYLALKDFSHYSNNLYNYSLYIAKEYFKETGKYIGLNKLIKEVGGNENYKLLPAQSAQQIVRLLDKNFRSFFALLRKKQSGTYNDKINIPKFKKKGDTFNIIYTFQSFRITKGFITLNSSNEYKKINPVKLKIPFTFDIDGKVKQIIIKPYNKGQYFNCYLQYEENTQKEELCLNKDKYLSIDLGLNNFASVIDTDGHSFILNGKSLKSYNIWYNKRKAKLKSELKKKNKKEWSKQLQLLEEKRKWFIDNYFNQFVSTLIKHCIKYQIGNIVIGYNETWKSGINLGKRNNQNFIYIPFLNFKRKLENKCNENEIKFIQVEESYTSKCSALDLEPVKKQDSYLGNRIKRGLFKTSKGQLINADINGALNILRKVIGDDFIQPIAGLMFNPIKSSYNFNKNFQSF